MVLDAIQKVPHNHFVQKHSQFKSSRTQMFFKVGVLKNFTQVFSVNVTKFLRAAFFIEKPPVAAFFSLIK